MATLLRREVPLLLAFFIIGIMWIDWYIVHDIPKNITSIIQDFAIIVGAIASGVGLINIFGITMHRYNKKEDYWYLDIWMWFMIVITIVTGVIGGIGVSPSYKWLMQRVSMPIMASIRAMVFFDICYAFYKTFRLKSMESLALFSFAIITILGNTPMIASFLPQAVTARDWIINVPVGAGARAFTIITAIGLIAFTLRTLMGHERVIVGVTD